MHAIARRVWTLIQRYRVDRRLPPQTRELYERTIRLRVAEQAYDSFASARPVLGFNRVDGLVARLGKRRLKTAGPLERPMAEVALGEAQRICELLEAGGLEPFVVDRRGDRLIVGVELLHRKAAIEALALLADEPGWFVEWHDRDASGILALADAAGSRRVARSRAWSVFRAYAVGDRATGPELGVVMTFWAPGTSGQLERIGSRGQERLDPHSPRTLETIDGRSFSGRSAFPVGDSLSRFTEPIDVVYTWVDGSDPDWMESFRKTAREHGRQLDEASLDPARFHSRDELRYSLRSLWMYCGWVRNIYLVTAGQRPHWLIDGQGVTVVDHTEILPPSALPTFNSHSIEAAIHRIEGLSEHFVYFNDDMLVARPLRPETFFHPNGLPYWFPSDARVSGVEHAVTQAVDTAAIRGRELLLKHFGQVAVFKPLHSPYPLRRSVVFEIEETFPEILEQTRHSPFRSPSDLSVAASFSQHYAFASGRAVEGRIRSEYVHLESGRLQWHLDRIRLDRELETCCINETELDGVGDEREAMVRQFFTDKYPVPAPWEPAD